MTTLSTYLSISRDLPKWQGVQAKAPAVATATKYYQAHIGEAKSGADLVRNPRLFDYAMKAFGLGDRLYAKGLMTRAMNEGVLASGALANKLGDPNVLAFVKAFDFKDKGAGAASTAAEVKNVVALYTENALEADQGKQNEGVELALYFQRKAPAIKDAYAILADKKLLSVVQTALGISPMTGLQQIDTQAAMLGAKVKIADFQDAKKLQTFIARFAAMYDYANGTSAAGAGASNAILLDASQGASFATSDSGLLAKLQTYRAG